MEPTKAEKRMIGRRASKRIMRRVYAWRKKNSDLPSLKEVSDRLVEQWYNMFRTLNGK